LFLVAGLISALPEALFGKLLLVFVFPPTLLALICSAALGLSLFFIFALCEGAERRLLIQQATRQVGTTLLAGDARHLSLRLNSSGVMAPLCATLIMAMALESTRFARPYLGDAIADVLLLVSPLRPTGTVIYWLLIAFLHFFFTAVIINPTGTADALRRHGWFLPGIRPGNMTVEYIDYVGMRVAVIGSLYLPLVILAPHIAYIIGVDVGFGGLALLFIFIGISSLVTDIQRHLLAHQYEGLIKKAKLQGATRAR
jgi:preprotein translocase subunit SecY